MKSVNTPALKAVFVTENLLMAALYYATAQLGLALAIPPGVASAVWPPSGFALAAILLKGPRLWPGIWIGSFLANLSILQPPSFSSFSVVIAIASASTLQALVGGSFLKKFNAASISDSLGNVLKFASIEALACSVAASLGALCLFSAGYISAEHFFKTWITWWVGDLVGVIVITPLCLSVVKVRSYGIFPKRLLEAVLFFILLSIQSHIVFGRIFPFSYSLFPFIFYAAFRFRSFGVSVAVLIVASAAIESVLKGTSIFMINAPQESGRALFLTQTFLGVYTLTGMAMAAALEERRRAARELKKWEHIFSFAGWPVSISNPAGTHFTDVNPAYAKMHGYEVEELIGKPIEMIYADGGGAQLRQQVEEARQKGDCVFECTHRRKDGSLIPGLTHLSVYRSGSGSILYYAATFQEIANLKTAEENLKKLAAELDRSNKELEQFAYIASHDLQEPLRVITMYLELLAKRYKGKFGKEADEFIEYARIGADDSIKMVRSLLEFARIGSQGKPFAPTNFEEVLKRALTHLELNILENNAKITHDPLPVVMADSLQMVRLVQNLLSNAIKYRREDPPVIHVSAKKAGNDWVFGIRDNGIGIGNEYLERIFGIFQRLHSRSQGVGIGLAICKKIVERHGGRIWVESLPGSGSTFFFSIPERVLAAPAEELEQPGLPAELFKSRPSSR